MIAWLSNEGSGHWHNVPFDPVAMTKLLHHSVVLLTPIGTITCWSLRLSNYFSIGCSTCAMYLGYVWYGFVPSLTCKENVPLNHPTPESTSIYLLCNSNADFCTSHNISFLICPCNKTIHFLIDIKSWIKF